MDKRGRGHAAHIEPPNERERADWERAVGAWAEVLPSDARRLAIDDDGDGAALLAAMRRLGSDRVVARLRQAARGSSWQARAVRGLTDRTPTTWIGELLRDGRMAESLDGAARSCPDDRETDPGWRDHPERHPRPFVAVKEPDRQKPPTIRTPTEHVARWERALGRLAHVVDSPDVLDSLAKAALVGVEDDRAIVWCPGEHFVEWCQEYYADALAEALDVPAVQLVHYEATTSGPG